MILLYCIQLSEQIAERQRKIQVITVKAKLGRWEEYYPVKTNDKKYAIKVAKMDLKNKIKHSYNSSVELWTWTAENK